MFHVDSEVGQLRQVILHRPDLELKRLTPDNAADLLFDDVLWVSEAQAEHDAFADALRGALEALGTEDLARFLIGGITKREILELAPAPKSIAFHSLDLDGFVL